MALFWSLPSTYFSRSQAAVGIAAINTIGISAGFFCPFVLGLVKSMTGNVSLGIALIAVLMALSMLLTLFVIPASAMRLSRPTERESSVEQGAGANA